MGEFYHRAHRERREKMEKSGAWEHKKSRIQEIKYSRILGKRRLWVYGFEGGCVIFGAVWGWFGQL
jgi:hypothetical protein